MPIVNKRKKAEEGTLAAQPAYAFWVVVAGLIALVSVFGLALLRWDTARDVTAAMGSVAGVIAALVGAYFGIRGATYAALASGEQRGKKGGGGGGDDGDSHDGEPIERKEGERHREGGDGPRRAAARPAGGI